MRCSFMEVDLDCFEYNVGQIKKYVGEDIAIMPVIKANGYGTWINRINDVIEKFDIVAVALVSEAVKLRKHGYSKEIFVLNQPAIEDIPEIIENNITVGASDDKFIDELGKTNKDVKIHIEIDSGMGRTGIQPENIEEFTSKIKEYKNIKVEGIYTHLSSADYDMEYTKMQFEKFDYCVQKAKEQFGDLKYVHSSASNGILNFPDKKYTLARGGIIIYGYPSFDTTYEKIRLKPICKLKSKITFLKEVEPGTSISYSRKFITSRKTKVATVPIGYADGIRRELINGGEVVINGEKAPIIGTVCMDSFMVDVTDIENVEVGTEVYIWDNEIITLEEIAEKCGTINYEIMSQISERVPRVFIKDGKKVKIYE